MAMAMIAKTIGGGILRSSAWATTAQLISVPTQKKFVENEPASYRTGSMREKASGLVAGVGFEPTTFRL
jgi:hypothetical protein